ncbi:hypothetical protein MBLNU457_6692t1 [Dothideomycetes sp. NU457]
MAPKNQKPGKTSSGSRRPEVSTASSSRTNGKDEYTPSNSATTRLQQHILRVFQDACAEPLGSELDSTLQEVKGHLYNRDFATAFGNEKYLWAYAARWSPSRALGYLQIFQDISDIVSQSVRQDTADPRQSLRSSEESLENELRDQLNLNESTGQGRVASTVTSEDAGADEEDFTEITKEEAESGKPPAYEDDSTAPTYVNPPSYGAEATPPTVESQTSRPGLRIASIGGGAGAELVATAGWLRLQADEDNDSDDPIVGEAPVDLNSVEMYCVDIAEWSSVVNKLETAITTPPAISKYASAAAKAANTALVPAGAMKIESIRQDVLDANPDCLRSIFQSSDLITMMFTLNELYSTSVSKTQRLLFELTVAARPGTLLLVVDSPGSYSTVTINGAEKKYPMQWLLDHTLLEASKKTRVLPPGDHWTKVLTDESRWFRLPQGLEYPIELENMRYQIHLYRRNEVEDEPLEHKRAGREAAARQRQARSLGGPSAG